MHIQSSEDRTESRATERLEGTPGREELERTDPISVDKFSPNSLVDPSNMRAQGEYIKIKDLNRNLS